MIAGSALLIDYVLTVAVSGAAGVDAITSAFLVTRPYAVPLSLAFVGVVVLGVGGALFAAERYLAWSAERT